MSSEFDEEYQPYEHAFEPYPYDAERCGYVSADDDMCGHGREVHVVADSIPRTADGDQAGDPPSSGV